MASISDHPAASAGAAPAAAGSQDAAAAASPVKRAATAWKRPMNGSVVVEVAAGLIMDAESWPALPGLSCSPPVLPGLSSPPPVLPGLVSPMPPPPKTSPKASPSPPSTGAVISPVSQSNLDAPNANPDHAPPVCNTLARRALVIPAGDGPERYATGAEPTPVHAPNNRNNTGGDHHNGRHMHHPHGRGGSYGLGNRRGHNGGIPNVGGVGHRRLEHHGGSDGRRGRGHGPGHQQRGSQQAYTPMVMGTQAPPALSYFPFMPFLGRANPHAPHYGPPIGFQEPQVFCLSVPPSEAIPPMPFLPPPASLTPEQISHVEAVRVNLLRQIEYYFSEDNLCKDTYLRKHMDEQGWVPLNLILHFRKVAKMTNNLQFLLYAASSSTVVEVQGEKIRKRTKWENWLLPRQSYSAGSSSGSLSPVTSNADALASQFHSVGLDGGTYHTRMLGTPSEAVLSRSATSNSLDYEVPASGGLHSNGNGPLIGPKSERSLSRSDTF